VPEWRFGDLVIWDQDPTSRFILIGRDLETPEFSWIAAISDGEYHDHWLELAQDYELRLAE
jgi:hypothetical protein